MQLLPKQIWGIGGILKHKNYHPNTPQVEIKDELLLLIYQSCKIRN